MQVHIQLCWGCWVLTGFFLWNGTSQWTKFDKFVNRSYRYFQINPYNNDNEKYYQDFINYKNNVNLDTDINHTVTLPINDKYDITVIVTKKK